MAITANSFTTYDAVGNREDLTDVIHNISPVETWVTSNTGNVNGISRLHEWQTDTVGSAAQNAQIEGNEFTPAAVTATTRLNNVMQIISENFQVTDTQDIVDKGGRASELNYQIALHTKKLEVDIEYALVINGAAVTGTTGAARVMKGMQGFISTNTETGTGAGAEALTETMFKDALQAIWVQGGFPQTALCGGFQRTKIDAFSGNGTRFLPMTQPVLETSVDVYRSSFGNIAIRLHHVAQAQIPDVVLILGDMDLWRKAWLRRPTKREFPRNGDSRRCQIITELTLESGNEKGSGRITDLTVA